MRRLQTGVATAAAILSISVAVHGAEPALSAPFGSDPHSPETVPLRTLHILAPQPFDARPDARPSFFQGANSRIPAEGGFVATAYAEAAPDGTMSRSANDGPRSGSESRSRSGGTGGSDASSLAAKTQNPISDLASVPYQMNFDFGATPFDRTRFIGNLQPVVPLKISEDWSLISRLIVPTVNAPIGADLREDGLGDGFAQFFFTPAKPSKFIWGVGPMFMLPTASDPSLGIQEWGAGLAAVGLVSDGPIVAGTLVTQTYSFEGTSKPFLIQPFFNYNFRGGWFASLSGEFGADWEARSADRWSAVLGPGFGRTFVLHGQAMNLSTRFAPYLEKPSGGPDWQLRLQFALLFPK